MNVQVGDRVIRRIGGSIEMHLKVTKVTEKIIECGAWTFDRATGCEIDEDLGWGPPPLMTGSFIQGERNEKEGKEASEGQDSEKEASSPR